MSEALFRFSLGLESFDRLGVVFSAWKPRGVEDALTLDTGDPSATLQVWAAGWDGGPPQNDLRDDVPLVQAEVLWGQLRLTGLSEDDLALLRLPAEVLDHDTAEGKAYRDLIERVVCIIHNTVEPLFTALHLVYGQYWVASFPRWYQEHESLRDYCGGALGLKVSLDGGVSWSVLAASLEAWRDRLRQQVEASAAHAASRDYSVYIQEADWRGLPTLLQQLAQPNYRDPTLQVIRRLLVNLRYALENGVSRYAFVEAISLLEVALGFYIKQAAPSERTRQRLQSFLKQRDESLPNKVSALLLNLPGAPEDVDLCVDAIATRNAVVHQGEEPPQQAQAQLEAVLRVVSALLPGLPLRFPAFPEDYW